MISTGRNRWRILTLLVLFSSYLSMGFCRVSFDTALPTMIDDRNLGPSWNTQSGSRVVGFAMISVFVGKLVFGLLADRILANWIFFGCMVGMVVSTSLMSLIGWLPIWFPVLLTYNNGIVVPALLTTMWCVTGFFLAGMWPSIVPIISTWFPRTRWGTIYGIMALSSRTGNTIGTLCLGTFLISGQNWRYMYLLAAAVTLTGVLLGNCFLYASPSRAGFKNTKDVIPIEEVTISGDGEAENMKNCKIEQIPTLVSLPPDSNQQQLQNCISRQQSLSPNANVDWNNKTPPARKLFVTITQPVGHLANFDPSKSPQLYQPAQLQRSATPGRSQPQTPVSPPKLPLYNDNHSGLTTPVQTMFTDNNFGMEQTEYVDNNTSDMMDIPNDKQGELGDKGTKEDPPMNKAELNTEPVRVATKLHPLANVSTCYALFYFFISPRFWLISASQMSATMVTEMSFLFTLYLKDVKHLSPGLSSTLTSVFGVGTMISIFAGGPLYDKINYFVLGRTILMTLLCMLTTGCAVLLWLLPGMPVEGTLAVYFIFGVSISPVFNIPIGVFASSFGGPKHCAKLSSIVEAVAVGFSAMVYLVSGIILERYGWSTFLAIIAALCGVSVVTMFLFQLLDAWARILEVRKHKKAEEEMIAKTLETTAVSVQPPVPPQTV